jgi:hypothetical protein
MDACRRGVQEVVTARTAEWPLETQCTSLFKIRMKICTQTAAGGQIPAQTWVREMAGKWVRNKEFGHKGWVWEPRTFTSTSFLFLAGRRLRVTILFTHPLLEGE